MAGRDLDPANLQLQSLDNLHDAGGLDPGVHRDAHLNMRPSDLLRELEVERMLLQKMQTMFIKQLSALQMEEATLRQLQISVLEEDSSLGTLNFATLQQYQPNMGEEPMSQAQHAPTHEEATTSQTQNARREKENETVGDGVQAESIEERLQRAMQNTAGLMSFLSSKAGADLDFGSDEDEYISDDDDDARVEELLRSHYGDNWQEISEDED
eukprot:comp13139_c1_seq1/m.8460 comp13139_c1_seq1/g.8460  ORF comp13139_c1_seq1/g.8460 comp13139_c1_seq1/m.8460 type:complete len:212 (-) comp13139_c1_seq1:313-948(-)